MGAYCVWRACVFFLFHDREKRRALRQLAILKYHYFERSLTHVIVCEQSRTVFHFKSTFVIFDFPLFFFFLSPGDFAVSRRGKKKREDFRAFVSCRFLFLAFLKTKNRSTSRQADCCGQFALPVIIFAAGWFCVDSGHRQSLVGSLAGAAHL